MNLFKTQAWVALLAVFLSHQILQKGFGLTMPFMDHYLDPFCLGAFGLYGVQLERKYFFGAGRLHISEVIFIAAFLALVSEVVFPYFSDKFVQDWGGVISIALGTGWYLAVGPGKRNFGES